MTKSIFTSFMVTIMLLFTACNGNAQNSKKTATKSANSTIQIIQFHSEHRCMTCNLIEKLTKETLQKYPAISFSLVNVDDKKNEKQKFYFFVFLFALIIFFKHIIL